MLQYDWVSSKIPSNTKNKYKMNRKIEAIVESNLLIWARESIGFEIESAAKKIGIKPEKLKQWEQGDSKPSIAQLKKIANIYKRPLAVFYLPSPPKDFDALHDFRRLAEAPSFYSPELLFLTRVVQEKREVYLELLEITESDVMEFKPAIQRSTNYAQIATYIRELLKISVDMQFGWKTNYDALNAWKTAIENLGVLVFQSSDVLVEEMRGFAIYQKEYPIIVINAKDSPTGRIFTLLHEFVHLLLKQGGVCNLEEIGIDKEDEVFCNLLAASILVPSKILEEQPIVASVSSPKEWADKEISALADKFKVSREVIVRRLLYIHRATKTFYEKKRAEFLEYSNSAKAKATKKGFLPVANKVVRDFGKPFVQTVLNAYYSDTIGASAVSGYLGVRLKHLQRITMLGSNYASR